VKEEFTYNYLYLPIGKALSGESAFAKKRQSGQEIPDRANWKLSWRRPTENQLDTKNFQTKDPFALSGYSTPKQPISHSPFIFEKGFHF
jgi:hypothetical protein